MFAHVRSAVAPHGHSSRAPLRRLLVLCAIAAVAGCGEDGGSCNAPTDAGSDGALAQDAKLVSCTAATDCPPARSPCTVPSCSAAGFCIETPAPDGQSCDDKDPCTDATTCSNGLCIGTFTCACQDGACKPGLLDTPCKCSLDADCKPFEDGDACNGTIYCNASTGYCEVKAATIPTCSGPGEGPCKPLQCDPQDGACKALPLPETATCDTENVTRIKAASTSTTTRASAPTAWRATAWSPAPATASSVAPTTPSRTRRPAPSRTSASRSRPVRPGSASRRAMTAAGRSWCPNRSAAASSARRGWTTAASRRSAGTRSRARARSSSAASTTSRRPRSRRRSPQASTLASAAVWSSQATSSRSVAPAAASAASRPGPAASTSAPATRAA